MDVLTIACKESRRDMLTTFNWSLYEQLLKCTALPENIINGILLRAEEMITTAITTVPVESIARMVKSKSNPFHLRLMQVFQDGKAIYDENCPKWMSPRICSAVAYCLNVSSDLDSWFAINSEQPNLTNMIDCLSHWTKCWQKAITNLLLSEKDQASNFSSHN